MKYIGTYFGAPVAEGTPGGRRLFSALPISTLGWTGRIVIRLRNFRRLVGILEKDSGPSIRRFNRVLQYRDTVEGL